MNALEPLSCPVSMWPGNKRPIPYPCGKPLADGAQFCESHEAQRIQLGGKP